jgi:hypothetical protein
MERTEENNETSVRIAFLLHIWEKNRFGAGIQGHS